MPSVPNCHRTPVPWMAAACLALLPLGLRADIEGTSMRVPPLVEVDRPLSRKLRFSDTMPEVVYRQEIRTTEFYRPAGLEKGHVTEHTIRQEFQVRAADVPGMNGVIRLGVQPLAVGAKLGEQVATSEVEASPTATTFMLETGHPCTLIGETIESARPTALVFPRGEITPGATWARQVAPSPGFEVPVEARFEYLREVRAGGRLCAEIELQASASGQLPEGRGRVTMRARTTFLFDIRLGRVLHLKTRLFQSIIGDASDGRPPEKRKVEQAIEMFANL